MFRQTSLLAAAALFSGALCAAADEVSETRDDIAATMGGVPSFVDALPEAALPGMWKTARDFQFNPDTALDPKTKALISLGVAAQIPCEYCIWQDTNAARAAGATEAEIAEAVGIAATTRMWSTMFYGLEVDLETFKAELGG